MKISAIAMAYAHSIGFDSAMRVGTFNGCPLYVCKLYSKGKEIPCIGLPQYLIIKDMDAIPLTLEETMIILRKKQKKIKR